VVLTLLGGTHAWGIEGNQERMHEMNRVDVLRGHGGMMWTDTEQGWVTALNEVVDALSSEGFDGRTPEVTAGEPDVLSGDGTSSEPDSYREDGGEA
jgi:hypothetical protein